ncbi:uncharacterized protein [Anabrus simplex]
MWRTGTLLLALLAIVAVEVDASQETAVDDGPNHVSRTGKAGIYSATKSVLAEIARELVARTATNSQILSLNLTNLLILVVLKALLFGAGLFSFGMLKGGRSAEVPQSPYPTFNESELLLLLSYLVGDADHKYGCLHRVACEEPHQASQYVAGAGMLIKGAKVFSKVIPYNPRYETIVADVKKAAEYGLNGGICEQRYSCSKS